MKVLIIDEWLPWPLDSGKKIRSFNLISRLARKHDIIYVAYADIDKDNVKIDILNQNGIKVVPVQDTRTPKWTMKFYFEVALNLLSREPFSTRYHIKQNFIDVLKFIQDHETLDLVHCEWTNLAPFLGHIKGIPCIISAHNIESDIWKRLGKHGSSIFKRMVGYNQAKKVERLEREWYPRVDLCIAVSPQDMKVIEGYGARVALVDNGVDINYYNNICQSEINNNSIIFTASFDTFSNQDGIDYFIKDIYPLIKRSKPDVRLWIVGKNPSNRIRLLSRVDPSIYVTGTVEDVRVFIAKSALCVVPLRIGGGSRLKILEAFAMKKAVISTSVGAEGLNVTHEKDIIIADTPELFSKYVVEYLKDEYKRKVLEENAYMLVKERYDWDKLADIQNSIWLSLKQ